MSEKLKYAPLVRVKITTDHSISFAPDWSHSSSLDIFVGQMEDARNCPTISGEPNRHRSAWAPFVLLGDEREPTMRGFNPRAARYLARKLLEAADLCEKLEADRGWLPAVEDAKDDLVFWLNNSYSASGDRREIVQAVREGRPWQLEHRR